MAWWFSLDGWVESLLTWGCLVLCRPSWENWSSCNTCTLFHGSELKFFPVLFYLCQLFFIWFSITCGIWAGKWAETVCRARSRQSSASWRTWSVWICITMTFQDPYQRRLGTSGPWSFCKPLSLSSALMYITRNALHERLKRLNWTWLGRRIDHNRLTGSIPRELSGLPNLRTV